MQGQPCRPRRRGGAVSFFGGDKPLGTNQAFPVSFPHFCARCRQVFSAKKSGQKYCGTDCMVCAGREERQMGRSASLIINPNEWLKTQP